MLSFYDQCATIGKNYLYGSQNALNIQDEGSPHRTTFSAAAFKVPRRYATRDEQNRE